jgi:hypothetical protein
MRRSHLGSVALSNGTRAGPERVVRYQSGEGEKAAALDKLFDTAAEHEKGSIRDPESNNATKLLDEGGSTPVVPKCCATPAPGCK